MTAILVPLDGSKPALRAVQRAIEHARLTRATVHLLNVEPEFDDYGMVRAYMSREKHSKLAVARAKAILQPAARLLARAGVRHQQHVVFGEPAAEIARAARRLKCDSIVMGSRGMGPIKNLLLGSVATKVIHLARRPVTLVR